MGKNSFVAADDGTLSSSSVVTVRGALFPGPYPTKVAASCCADRQWPGLGPGLSPIRDGNLTIQGMEVLFQHV
jgi:hypothetical protein